MHNILLGKKFSIDGTHLDIPSSFEAQSPENYHSNFSQARPLPGGEEEEEDRILIFLTACMKDHGWSSLHPSEAQPTLPTTVVCFTKHTHSGCCGYFWVPWHHILWSTGLPEPFLFLLCKGFAQKKRF